MFGGNGGSATSSPTVTSMFTSPTAPSSENLFSSPTASNGRDVRGGGGGGMPVFNFGGGDGGDNAVQGKKSSLIFFL